MINRALSIENIAFWRGSWSFKALKRIFLILAQNLTIATLHQLPNSVPSTQNLAAIGW